MATKTQSGPVVDALSGPTKMPAYTEGQTVHYVLHEGKCIGESRAAIIVRTCDGKPSQEPLPCSLRVFTRGLELDGVPAEYQREEVPYSDAPKPGTWHFRGE